MKALKFNTHDVTTLDNDGDEHVSSITYAVVDKDLADQGEEVALRNGEARKLKAGDVVVPAGNQFDVFSADDWESMWSDSKRVADAGDTLKHVEPEYKDAPDESTDDPWADVEDEERAEFEEWKASRDRQSAHDGEIIAVDNDERPQDVVPSAPKDDVAPKPATAKKAATSSGKRS